MIECWSSVIDDVLVVGYSLVAREPLREPFRNPLRECLRSLSLRATLPETFVGMKGFPHLPHIIHKENQSNEHQCVIKEMIHRILDNKLTK